MASEYSVDHIYGRCAGALLHAGEGKFTGFDPLQQMRID
jgi:hypothetical protein